MQEELIKEFFDGVKRLLDDKRERDVYEASDFNVVDILRPNENQLSNIIADLLDPMGKHGQRDLFLNGFLNIIGVSRKHEAQKVKVIREDLTRYIMKPSRRIDITIDFDSGEFGIGVENKPWAGESEDQIPDYKEHLKKKYKGDKFMLVYLSGDGSEPQSIGKDEREALKQKGRLKVLAYSTDFKDWLEFCYKECKAEKVRWILRDFIDYVEENFK